MSEERYQWTTEYDGFGTEAESKAEEQAEDLGEETVPEEAAAPEEETAPEEQAEVDAELAARIAARRKSYRRQRIRRKYLMILAVILIFAALFTMCGREIFRLKAENYALKKQQKELEAERDRLARELENVGDKDYIKDQARKQLRLLDPGEIMFVFEDSEAAAAEEDAAAETQEGTQTEANDEG